jgi:hypothetical protein
VKSCFYFTAFPLERELQGKLNVSRITHPLDATEIRSVADVAVGVQELRVIERIEKLRPELKVFVFPDRQYFLNRQIEVRDAGSATDGPRRVAQQLQRC